MVKIKHINTLSICPFHSWLLSIKECRKLNFRTEKKALNCFFISLYYKPDQFLSIIGQFWGSIMTSKSQMMYVAFKIFLYFIACSHFLELLQQDILHKTPSDMWLYTYIIEVTVNMRSYHHPIWKNIFNWQYWISKTFPWWQKSERRWLHLIMRKPQPSPACRAL